MDMDINWDVDPRNGVGVFFSNDLYEALSFVPALERQWEAVHRASGDAYKQGRTADADGAKVTVVAAQSPRGAEPVAAEGGAAYPPQGIAQPSTGACTGPAVVRSPLQVKTVQGVALPEPRVPYPCYSALTEAEQKQYLYLLKCSLASDAKPGGFRGGWSQRLTFQHLKQRVAEEVPEFLRFVHNAAKQNHADYEHMCPAAMLFSQKYFEASARRVQLLPPFYSLMETLMLTAGGATSFAPLTLAHHKTLLVLGKAPFVKLPSGLRANMLALPSSAEALLPLFSEVTSLTELNEDVNVDKLAVKYGIRVCITADALFTLLNNHGPSFQDAWEVPVCVRQSSARTDLQADTLVFIESPLPPKEWTVRERNHIFFQAALEVAMMNSTSSVALEAMTLEQPTSSGPCPVVRIEMPLDQEHDAGLDLTSDYTEMETFGDEMPIPHQQPSQDLSAIVDHVGETRGEFHDAGTKGGGGSKATEENRRPPPGVIGLLTAVGIGCMATQSTNQSPASASECPPMSFGVGSERVSPSETGLENMSSSGVEGVSETWEHQPSESGAESSDTELIIDEGNSATGSDKKRGLLGAACMEQPTYSELSTCEEQSISKKGPCTQLSPACLSSSGQVALLISQGSCQELGSNSSPRTRATRAAQKRWSGSTDTGPLGHILKMQTKLMEAQVRRPAPASHGLVAPPAPTMALPGMELSGSEQRPPNFLRVWPSGNSHDTRVGSGEVAPAPEVQGAELFPKELLLEQENASEFVSPAMGNVAYKLLSLAEMPLLVRTHVQRAQTRPKKASRMATKKHVPVRVFAKTEYQACYGLEANTAAEDCALWLEATLNSNSWFYRGRVDVLTAEPLLVEELSSADLHRSLHYNHTEPLKLLQRIMKRLYSLPAGHYLLSHVAGDVSATLYRSVSSARSAYNLHSAHGQLPKAVCSPCVPWVPINTSLLLPFHSQYGRVPGTFPPAPQPHGHGTANKIKSSNKTSDVHRSSYRYDGGHLAPGKNGGEDCSPGNKKKKKNKGMKRKVAWEQRKQQQRKHNSGSEKALPGQS